MNRKRYKYIHRLVDKITTSPSNNMEFCCYGHLVSLQSYMGGYVAVTLYNTTDRYSGELADFDFDYWMHRLHVDYAENDRLFQAIENAFKNIYGEVRVSREEEEGC